MSKAKKEEDPHSQEGSNPERPFPELVQSKRALIKV